MKNDRNGQAEILTPEQFTELLGELKNPHRTIAAVCYFTSCRISEAVALKAGDIVNGRIQFRSATTKAKKTKEVSIPKKLQDILTAAGLPTDGYLFPSPRKADRPISTKAFDLALREKCDYLGLKGVSTHSFRRSSITAMYRAGVDLKTIQQRSGHASIANVGLYIEGLDGNADKAGEVL